MSEGVEKPKSNLLSFVFYSTVGFVILKNYFLTDLLNPVPWPVASILAAFWYIRSISKSVRSEAISMTEVTGTSESKTATMPNPPTIPKFPKIKKATQGTPKKDASQSAKQSVNLRTLPTMSRSQSDANAQATTREAAKAEPGWPVRTKRIRMKVTRSKVVREKRKSPDRHY